MLTLLRLGSAPAATTLPLAGTSAPGAGRLAALSRLESMVASLRVLQLRRSSERLETSATERT